MLSELQTRVLQLKRPTGDVGALINLDLAASVIASMKGDSLYGKTYRDIYDKAKAQENRQETGTLTYFVTRKSTSPRQVLSDLKRDLGKALPPDGSQTSEGQNLEQMAIYADKKHRKAIEVLLKSYGEFSISREVL